MKVETLHYFTLRPTRPDERLGGCFLGAWKGGASGVLASSLIAGNQVLTKSGHATITSVKKQFGRQKVYNLEVRDLHNFLVGDFGVVVHNACWKTVNKVKKMSKADRLKWLEEMWDKGTSWTPSNTKHPIFGRGRYAEAQMRKGRYKDFHYTGKGFKGDKKALGISNYPSIDFYKGNVATSMKTTRNSNPWSWRNQNYINKKGEKVFYNRKHLDDLKEGIINGSFGNHDDLQNVNKVNLDIFVKEIDVDFPESIWQEMVDDFLKKNGGTQYVGKIKVNILKLENYID